MSITLEMSTGLGFSLARIASAIVDKQVNRLANSRAAGSGFKALQSVLLAPPDLRGRDTSFADEAAAGSFGLAGFVATLGGRSPFAVEPPAPRGRASCTVSAGCATSMRSPSREARSMAEQLVGQWMRTARGRNAHAWAPEVVGRRVLSWLAHAGVLLDGADRKRYAAVMGSLAHQVSYLAASWRNAPDGYPRLVALIGLVHADLCIAGRDLPAGAIAEAARRRAGAPDPARRRHTRAATPHPRRAAARSPAAAPVPRRARPAPRTNAARGRDAHDGDAAPPAARRRRARPLQRHGRHRARCARHRAGL